MNTHLDCTQYARLGAVILMAAVTSTMALGCSDDSGSSPTQRQDASTANPDAATTPGTDATTTADVASGDDSSTTSETAAASETGTTTEAGTELDTGVACTSDATACNSCSDPSVNFSDYVRNGCSGQTAGIACQPFTGTIPPHGTR